MSAPRDPALLVRPEVRELSAYHLDLSPCRHKLDQNEAPFEPPAPLKRRVAAQLAGAEWARYPDFHAEALRQALGELHGWPAAGVLAGNGSNELLDVCLAALAGPGREVLGVEPSFGLYRSIVAKTGAVPHFVQSDGDLRLPVAALLAEVERQPRRTLLLCSPNNPTGAALTPEEVDALAVRQEGPLLLDNAYGEFCRHDYRPLLDRHPHLVLLRTFSKAWALAGLRLGYLLADPRLVAQLLKAKLPYNLGRAAVLAGQAVLAAAPAARRRIATVVARRPGWSETLAAAGLEVFPSEANFLLVRCPADPMAPIPPRNLAPAAAATAAAAETAVAASGGGSQAAPGVPPAVALDERAGRVAAAHRLRDGLAARSIRVRDVGSYPGLAGCLRVSVGNGAALRAVRAALAEMAASGGLASASTSAGMAAAAGSGLGVAAGREASMALERHRLTGGVARDSGVEERGAPASSPEPDGASRGVARPAAGRRARIERQTGETRVLLELDLDGGARRIEVGNGFFAHMLQALATHGGLGLRLVAAGDLQVDLHHTVEDVGIALGDALAAALGERRGVVRFGAAYAPLDEALARAVIDLSGRGFFAYSAPPEVAASWVTAEFPLTLVADFFQAVADRGRLTLHLEILAARNGHHAAEAAFKAAALALRQAVARRSTPPPNGSALVAGPSVAQPVDAQQLGAPPSGTPPAVRPGADEAAAADDVPSTKGTLTA